jgi:2-phospho-L-lactate guanylyltransferase
MKRRLRYAGRTHAIVPLNVLSKSKARLSSMLTTVERERLTVAMLKDVLDALEGANRVHSVTVVSADTRAHRICTRHGASFLWEGKRRGLNKGVRLAVRDAQLKGASSVLVIHSDLPLLKPLEVDFFIKQSQGYSVALTPSKDRRGTNALLMSPPNVIRPLFGRNSFQRHLSVARQKGARVRVLRLKGIGFDVDLPKDLATLMHRPLRNETGRFLQRLGELSSQFDARYSRQRNLEAGN